MENSSTPSPAEQGKKRAFATPAGGEAFRTDPAASASGADGWRRAGRLGWAIGMLGAALAGAALRLVDLDNRPMHADEAVQALRFARLLEQGQFRYDPQEYHGPCLPYFSWPVVRALGVRQAKDLEAWQLRLVPAGMGILLVLGPWCLRRSLGRPATLLAAWLTAISPVLVFYSRYYIAEMLLVGFSWGAMVGWWGVRNWLLRLSIRPKAKFPVGPLFLLGGCLGLQYATKETWVIALASMLLAAGLTMPRLRGVPKGRLIFALGVVLAAGTAVWAAMFSSFGQNPAGLLDSVKTYANYFRQAGGQGRGGQHIYPFWYYFQVLFAWKRPGGSWWTEAVVLVLALVGGLSAVGGGRLLRVKPRHIALAKFLVIYTLIQALIYSAIPYKTPWCALGFYHGMVVLAGLGGAVLWQWAIRQPSRTALVKKGLVLAFLLVGSGHLAWQAHRASFRLTADPTQPYLYAPTTLEVARLVAALEQIAQCNPDGHAMPIQVFFPDHQYWPLPWYLRRFNRVGWFGSFDEAAGSAPAPVILAHPDMERGLLEYCYFRQPPGQRRLYLSELGRGPSQWQIRPYVSIQLYLRWDLWEACAEKLSGQQPPPD
ncbi:MAG TPA: TIGR03663 family protein [Thermoguttaceae bacterium]|nr:TIGR03663 family protein [Thermoguttaceae bacterium]